jgi:glycosyltransferase involved in cell wall biosynthesis
MNNKPATIADIDMYKSNLVSIVVPVYNSDTHLSTTLESILSQEHATLEIICINDGSTDKSKEILYQFARRDSRIVVIDQENAGLGATRNRGIAEAKGEFICFLDSDDLYHPSFIAKSIEVLENTYADMVLCAANVLYEETGIITDFYDQERFAKMIGKGKEYAVVRKIDAFEYFSLEPCMVRRVWRKSFVDRIGMKFPEGILYEDVPVHFLCGITSSSIAVSNHLSFTYRVGRMSSLTKDNSVRRYDIVETFRVALNYLNEYKVDHQIGINFMILFMRMTDWCYHQLENSRKSGLVDLLNKFMREIPGQWKDAYLKHIACNIKRHKMILFETGIRTSILKMVPKSILRNHKRRNRLAVIKKIPFIQRR